ncbi:MAG: anti-sigma factor [Betaproteobacteria bacterium]
MNYDRPELLDRLAAEYVFGTMTGRVRRRFQRLRASLPAADVAAVAWEARTGGLAQSVPAVAPSPGLWNAIDRRTGGTGAAPEPARGGGIGAWAWALPLTGLVFGVLATVGFVRLAPDALVPIDAIVQARGTLPESYVGILTDTTGAATMLASSTRHGTTMSIKVLRPVEVPEGKVLQLWALPRGAEPFPLGVVPREGKDSFEMPETSEKLLSNVPRLAVSIEDKPAAPGTEPQGFILTGHCVKLW